ncbi:hypothetical protein GEV33_009388 [Tenebrio molitor]|uniref:Secreted protein n=1 Tax=Tenebrio molitor TaxID=7067 RepID=A0A8J6HFD0_TENMO|nr:hypothetical protein GEV33_009388 [Tenebrio molitor]
MSTTILVPNLLLHCTIPLVQHIVVIDPPRWVGNGTTGVRSLPLGGRRRHLRSEDPWYNLRDWGSRSDSQPYDRSLTLRPEEPTIRNFSADDELRFPSENSEGNDTPPPWTNRQSPHSGCCCNPARFR